MRFSALFMTLAPALALLACDGGGSNDPTPILPKSAEFTHGIAAGDVTETTAVLWTRADGGDRVKAEASVDDGFPVDKTIFTFAETSTMRDFTVKAKVSGLQPDTRYYYRFVAAEATSETGTFVTAPDAATSKAVRFVIGGDSDGRRNADGTPVYNEFDVLDAARSENPAFFLYFGDTIYGDRDPAATDVSGFRAKYRQNREYDALAEILGATSTVNAWDDHEVQNDFAGTTVDRVLFEAGRQAFLEYLPLEEGSGGVMYRSLRWGSELELIVLDERSFRSGPALPQCSAGGTPDLLPGAAAPAAPESVRGIRAFVELPPDPPAGCLEALNAPARTMLGADQKRFLLERLRSSTAKWKVIVNQVPMMQYYAAPYDRWEGYAAERAEILQFIRDNSIRNVVFLTTDVHANIFAPVRIDLTDAQPVAYEAIVGPIATEPLEVEIVEQLGEAGAGLFEPFLTGVIGVDCAELKSYSYGVVDIDTAGTMTITAKDAAGNELCTKTLEAVR
jgi:alkaline phosphatase D